MSKLLNLAVVVALVSLAGCGDKKEKAAPAAAKPTPAAPAAAPAAPAAAPAAPAAAPAAPAAAPAAPAAAATGGWTSLTDLKLQLQAGDGASIKDNSMGDMKSFMVSAGDATFSVSPTPDELKLKFEDAVGMAEMSGAGKVTAKEKLADGWHIQTTSDSGLVNVSVQRTVGGATVDCGVVAPDAAIGAKVAAACLSLKPL